MDIHYIEPLSRGYHRMKQALFQPFDLRKWFVVGFTAFLAGLTDCHGGSGGGGGRSRGRADLDDVLYFPLRAQEWLLDHPYWFVLILVGIFILFVLGTLLTWVSSRGKFMFLDNVVHDRAQVAMPWYDFRVQGNSLFLWSFTTGMLFLAAIIPYLVFSYSAIMQIYEQTWEPAALIAPAIVLVIGLIAIICVAALIDLLLVHFIVPLMYRSKVKVLAAWRMLLALAGRHAFYFVGYVLFVFVLSICIGIGIMLGVLLTCCIGLIFLIIPYINAVALLPISYTMRAFSVEFLEQFGPEYTVFPPAEAGGEKGMPTAY
jgi:hypothetical protein